jgi:hypothetical protein
MLERLCRYISRSALSDYRKRLVEKEMSIVVEGAFEVIAEDNRRFAVLEKMSEFAGGARIRWRDMLARSVY